MPLIRLADVSKVYPPLARGASALTAVDGVSLDIEAGDVYGVIGYSGAGKSTLARLINALEPATGGSIEIDGREIVGLPERELRRLRLGIGMVFQQFNLFGSKTVEQNVAYPLQVAGTPRAELRARVDEMLRFVGLSDKARSHPEQLSGGQKQRVGIARALAASPRILLADEATSALDPDTTGEVLALLRRINEELGVTIVVITHEMDVVQQLATKVAVMEAGRIVERGPVFDVFSAPREAVTRRFVSTVVRTVPSPEEAAVLRARHPGRLVTLSFSDGSASQGEVFAEIAQAGVPLELVYGGITDVRGRAFGHLTVALDASDAVIDPLLARLGARVALTEVPR
ncbi:ATP-binding cassette domain-containing protein [Rathayibacter festucae]|uniref:ATP-binding cassette domain-containing protein n=1 Tax=Rathayibacter festucae TaxID=110937 RepID=A0ABX6H393_9MICO|nr:methionine ABC transporter ATP-binding protein [Rathayibacter festucae]QHC64246.1 ATP-binding cassette domain-containing protein [Rathayibacter festucae]